MHFHGNLAILAIVSGYYLHISVISPAHIEIFQKCQIHLEEKKTFLFLILSKSMHFSVQDKMLGIAFTALLTTEMFVCLEQSRIICCVQDTSLMMGDKPQNAVDAWHKHT